MIRRRALRLLASAVAMVGLVSTSANAIDIVWDGGDGVWDDANWNGGSDLLDLIGTLNGAEGWGGPNAPELENITISGPTSIVTYDADGLQNDFRMKQGSTLTISDGATWQQVTTEDWSENRWTQMDLTALTIDGGTFSRVGEGPGDGAGALILGSWRGDDNFGKEGSLEYMETNILITNGGRLENDGELWFGGWTDTPPGGTVITMEINDGSLYLAGGEIQADGETPAWGALVFTNRFVDEFDQPTYAINFTGPGSITVDSTGIINTFVDEFEVWQNLDPITYEELWEAGILQVDGKSGADGESFSSYFTVSGSLGENEYTLTYEANVLVGDFNRDGTLNAPDINDLTEQSASLTNPAEYDLNADALVNETDVKVWIKDLFGSWVGDANLDGEFNSGDLVVVLGAGTYETGVASNWSTGDFNGDALTNSGDLVAALSDGGYELGPRAAVAAVPEPAGGLLALLGLLSAGAFGRSRRTR